MIPCVNYDHECEYEVKEQAEKKQGCGVVNVLYLDRGAVSWVCACVYVCVCICTYTHATHIHIQIYIHKSS